MASEAASYREDVEQARQRFEEFRQAHAVRSRLPEELWAAAAKLARRDGITATARVLGVDRPSLQKWTDRLEPRASTKSPKSPRRHPLGGSARASLRGTAGGQHGNGNQLCGGGRISQRRKAAAGSEKHRHQPTGRVDSRVCSVVGHAGHHTADADSGGGGGGRFPQGDRLVGRVVPRQTQTPIRFRVACLCSAAGGQPRSRCWFMTGRDSGWRRSALSKGRFRWWPQGDGSGATAACASSAGAAGGGRSGDRRRAGVAPSVDAGKIHFLLAFRNWFSAHCCYDGLSGTRALPANRSLSSGS